MGRPKLSILLSICFSIWNFSPHARKQIPLYHHITRLLSIAFNNGKLCQ